MNTTYTLTHAQRRVWFTELLDPGTSICNLAACVKFRGAIDLDVLRRALDFSVSRHDSLHFQLTEGKGEEPDLYLAEYRPLSIETIDLTKAGKSERNKWIDDQTSIPFKLFHSPLYQFTLLAISSEEVWLYAKFHHIIMDGISLNLLGNQLIEMYQKMIRNEPLPQHHEPSYLTYIEKEKQYLQSSRFEKDRLFWTNTYHTIPEHFPLTEKALPQQQSTAALRETLTLSHPLAESIRHFCEKHQISILSLFMASFYICISRMTSSKDIVIGTYYGNRASRLEKDMLGMFVSTLPIRMEVDPDCDVLSFVTSIGKEQLSVMRHQKYPYNLLMNELRHQHGDLQNLIVTSIQYQPLQWQQADGFEYETAMYFSGRTANQLSVSIKERLDTGIIQLNFDYQTAMFTEHDIKRIQSHLLTVLEKALEKPDQPIKNIDMVESNEKERILSAFNQTDSVKPLAPTLHGFFTRRAALSPSLPALRFSGGILTYGELDQYTNQLAVRLKKKGVAKESVVGVLADRSPEMVIAVLAVLKAGGAYVPLDPDYPEERLRYMLADSGARLLVTGPGLSVSGFSGETLEVNLSSLRTEPAENEPVCAHTDGGSLAYVIYTSGSTGTPKGVAVEHRQAAAFLSGMQRQFPLTEDDVIVLKSSFSFDASIWQLFWWMIPGASMYLLPQGWEKDPALMTEAFTNEGVTTAHFIPAMANSFLDQVEMETEEKRTSLAKTLKHVFAGGEALAPQTAARFARSLPETAVIHGYGPTEATVDAAFYRYDHEKDRERMRLPIGKPVPGARLYILDSEKAVQPIGVAGELYIAGAGVARGYLNRPELTEERFLDDPFYSGERMYQTGDLARWLPDGTVEWLGRMDGQVKIRGYRIEPGEVEAALRQIDGVREAAVVARTEGEETELCAYIEGQDQKTARTELGKRLPAYMMPSSFIEMRDWPVTPSGKLDRKALPAPDGAAERRAYTAPQTITEMKLAKLWEEVLKYGPAGTRDHFFEQGGHSLKATALVSRIAKAFGVQVPLKEIFAKPTLEELAAVIQELDESPHAAIEPADKQDTYPVSSAQKRMYVLQQLEDGGVGYNMPAALKLTGPFDRARLDEVFRQLIRRHESLRTSFETGADGEPVQRIHDDVPFQLMELAAAEDFVRPFRLQEAPLFRAALVKEAEESHLLLVDMHHITSDGVSVGTLIREFSELYANRMLAPLRIQYKDYAVWQQAFKHGEAYNRQEAYWLKQLDGELPVLELPADNARPAVRSFAGDHVSFSLDADTSSGLYKIARDNGCTLYMVLLAAYSTLLARLSGQEDIIIGSPIAGRPHKDLEPVIGMFVNTLAIRTQPAENKCFSDFLKEVRETALEAFEHQDYPFEELVDRLDVVRDMSRNPLFDVMFALQNMERESLTLHNLHLTTIAHDAHKVSKFDMTLYAAEEDQETIRFDVEFNTDIYQKQTIKKWLSYYIHILHHVIEHQNIHLGDIHVLDEHETSSFIHTFNQTKQDYPKHETISRLFEYQAAKTPHAPAVIYDRQTLTYRELNERANRIAAALRANGVGSESVVALLTSRTPELAVGILGILKAGGAYLPVTEDMPTERLEWMLSDSNAVMLLQSDRLESHMAGKRLFIEDIQLEVGISANNPEQQGGPDSLAYIMYTSGSTGTPKGVMVEQRGVVRLVKNSDMAFSPEDRILLTASLGFDAMTFEVFGPLLNGACLYISDKETYLDSDRLKTFIQQNGITTLWLTSSLFNQLSEQNERTFSDLSRLILGGEALSPNHVNRVRNAAPDLALWNGYGPTENTTFSTCFRIEHEYKHSIPIGRPIANSTAYIVNSRGRLQPMGVIGELCVGGDGLARGYFGRPELTKEKFVPNPFTPGERMYRTGDLARWLKDGSIEYIGRMDDQVKIRGYRIELGEIEAALRQIDGVKEAAVIVRTGPSGHKELLAYMSLQAEMNIEKVRSLLSQQLPGFMIPAHLVELAALPLTQNGKLDRRALPEPETTAINTAYAPPRNQLEERLAVIWQEVLGVEKVGIEDSFFELGGDSIKALQVSARLGRFDLKITAGDLFRHPTIKEAAPLIRKTERNIDQRPIEGEVPWTPVQRWFLAQHIEKRQHFNQSVMLHSSEGFQEQPLRTALQHLVIHHDALRMTIIDDGGQLQQFNRGIHGELYSLNIRDLSKTAQWEKMIEDEVADLQRSIHLQTGPLLKAGLFNTMSGTYLFLTIHHLVVDGVSWRILLEDLSAAYSQAATGQPVQLPRKTDSYQYFANRLAEYAESSKVIREQSYWRTVEKEKAALLSCEKPHSAADNIRKTESFTLSEEDTHVLIHKVNNAYNTDTQDILLTAASLALCDWMGERKLRIAMEGHGRDHTLPELDISRTVGWFTTIYPVLIDLHAVEGELGLAVKTVKDTLGRIPDKGMGYGILKYLTSSENKTIQFSKAPEIGFNYLGQFNDTERQQKFSFSGLASGKDITPTWQREQTLEMSAMVRQNQLHFNLSYPPSRFHKTTMKQLLHMVKHNLHQIIKHCAHKQETEKTVSDFSSQSLTAEDLDNIASFVEEL
ncbi:non-ribosomal peptide synthetase [Bacillus paralicheniformis]|uniref:non-ribosomal peptide synthetase n=1 Tax=Bacillus paralicheniformis TaxID=1648923 RepID=UPI001E3BEA40|nr:non-ribosomal peptide synthetase [Bacillus paralicheniformis]MCB6216990.1 amino acid adenylation domain-containing protein [Bacillus paralicheniformis]